MIQVVQVTPVLRAATVLVVAPPTLQRQGLLATLVAARPDLRLQPLADPGALAPAVRQRPFALIILDASLPGPPLDALIGQVRTVRPRQPVLVLGGRRLPFSLSRALMEMGAGALLAGQITPEGVVAAVTQLVGTKPGFPNVTTEALPHYTRPTATTPVLSRRELEILRLVVDELDNAEIAERLCLSVRTVESHRSALLQKTGARSMVGLAMLAVRQGWVEVERG